MQETVRLQGWIGLRATEFWQPLLFGRDSCEQGYWSSISRMAMFHHHHDNRRPARLRYSESNKGNTRFGRLKDIGAGRILRVVGILFSAEAFK
jgi:hypothetical protein